jgi:hypothetical protein
VTDTATHVPIRGEETAAAVFRDDWLPTGTPFPELTTLHEDCLRLKAQSATESAKVWEIQKKIEAHKQEREVSLRDAYRRGEVDAEIEDNSPELEQELAQAQERYRAAGQAYVEHINVCIATIVEWSPKWIATIEEHNANVHAEAAELEEKLREVLSRKGSFGKLEYWLQRTNEAAQMPAYHFPYADIPDLPSTDPAEQARERERFMMEAYAGSTTGAEEISDDASRAQEDAMSRPSEMSQEEYARLEQALRRDPGVLS